MPKYRVKTEAGTYIVTTEDPPNPDQTSNRKPIGSSVSGLRAPTGKDVFREGAQYNFDLPLLGETSFTLPGPGGMTRDLGRSVGSILGTGAGAVASGGNPGGTLLGSYLGGVFGDLPGQILEKYLPGYFGKIDDSGEGLSAALKNAGIDTAIDVATLGAGKAVNSLKSPGLRNMLKAKAERSAADLAAIKRIKEPNIIDIAPKKTSIPVGLFAKSDREAEIHEALRRGAKQLTKESREASIPEGQFAPLRNTISDNQSKKVVTPGQRAEALSPVYHKKWERVKKVERQAWERAIGIAEESKITVELPATSVVEDSLPNPLTGKVQKVKTVTPGEQVEITGPVYTINSAEIANKILPDIEKIIDSLPDWVKDKKTRIIDSLTKIAEKKMVNGSPINVEGLQAVKELMDDINFTNRNIVSTDKNKANFTALATALRKDIELSSTLWGDNGKKAWETADAATKWRNGLFPESFRKAAEADFFAGSSAKLKPDLVSKAAKDADFAKQVLAVTGESGRKQIAAQYIDDTLKNALISGSTENMGENLRAILRKMGNPTDPAKFLFTAKQQNSIQQLVRGMELTHNTKSLLFGTSVINWRRGYLAFGIGSAAVSGAIGSATGMGTILAVTFAPKPIIRKFLADPKFAKTLTRAVKVGADTPEGKWISKQMLQTLRGTYGIVLAGDNKKPVHVKITGKGIGYEPVSREEYSEWAEENE